MDFIGWEGKLNVRPPIRASFIGFPETRNWWGARVSNDQDNATCAKIVNNCPAQYSSLCFIVVGQQGLEIGRLRKEMLLLNFHDITTKLVSELLYFPFLLSLDVITQIWFY